MYVGTRDSQRPSAIFMWKFKLIADPSALSAVKDFIFLFSLFFFFGRKKFKEIILPNEIKYFSNTLFSGTKWKERRRTFQEGSDMVYILLQASARAVCYFISCPGTEEPGGLPSMGLHRVGHDWRDSAAALVIYSVSFRCSTQHIWRHSTVCMC